MIVWCHLAAIVASEGAGALVRLREVRGSAPREAGACMVVRPDGAFHGTIGGGRLEWEALADARAALADGRGAMRLRDYALGPDLGQCCGGRAIVSIETFDRRDLAQLQGLAAAEAAGLVELRCRMGEDGRVVRAAVP